MKKTITKMFAVASMVAGTVLSANAQIASGSLMFGGSFGADITLEKTTKVTGAPDVKNSGHTNWSFSPTVGYFISDGLALGLNLNIGSTFKKVGSSTDGKTKEHLSESNMGFGLFARKYMEISSNVYFHTQAGLGYLTGSFTDRVADGVDKLKDGNKTTTTDISLNITPGLTYFVSPKWGIDFSLNNIIGYTMTTEKMEGSGNTTGITTETTGGGFSIGAGLTPTLGLYYYMGK